MKVGERKHVPLTRWPKANARSSYKILAWVRGRHPWEVQIPAFAKNNCAHYEFRIEFGDIKL